MLKVVVVTGFLFIVGGLAGCNAEQVSQLSTQANGQMALKADQYSILVNFSAQGDATEKALSKLNSKLVPFVAWKESSDVDAATQSQSVRGIYTYPKNGPRQLTGYQAQQSFNVKQLNLQQYSDALDKLAKFQPESISQGVIGVSEGDRQKALKQAYTLAFEANERKLQTLIGLAHLCEPEVETIQEHTQSQGSPRTMMMMDAKIAPVANEHTVSVSLNITWRAKPC